MIKNISEVKTFSQQYEIPEEDIILTAINCTGINSETGFDRIRFRLKLGEEEYYMGLPVTRGESQFSLHGNHILLDGTAVGTALDVENDTCDTSYLRRNGTALTLNSNSRSDCKGCQFCGAYELDAEDKGGLKQKKSVKGEISRVLEAKGVEDLSGFVEIAICTGCFLRESDLVDHLLMVRDVAADFGFSGELKYIGSQLTTEESMNELERYAKPFSLYLTVECFTRRNQMLKALKSRVTIPEGKKILRRSAKRGFDTSILYVLGIDPLDEVVSEFEDYARILTRFPIINIFQPYKPHHISLRDPEASGIYYYMRARKGLEAAFSGTNLRPRPWENYRPLWYTKFGDEAIYDIRI